MDRNSVSGLHHAGLSVTHIDRSIRFYSDIIELDVLRVSEDPSPFAFLGKDGKVFLTLWQGSEGSYTTQTAGLHHLAFAVPDAEALSRVEGRLRAAGHPIRFDGIVAHREQADSIALFCEDPDGIRLELTAPRPAGTEYQAPTGAVTACGFF